MAAGGFAAGSFMASLRQSLSLGGPSNTADAGVRRPGHTAEPARMQPSAATQPNDASPTAQAPACPTWPPYGQTAPSYGASMASKTNGISNSPLATNSPQGSTRLSPGVGARNGPSNPYPLSLNIGAAASGTSGSTRLNDDANLRLELRVSGLEEDLQNVNTALKEHQQNPRGAAALRESLGRLATEVEASRMSRHTFETRVRGLEEALKHERDERDAWLSSFLSALKNTLNDLTTCVDHSIEDGGKLMRERMDTAEDVMSKLITRVDTIFSTNQAALPVENFQKLQHDSALPVTFRSHDDRSPIASMATQFVPRAAVPSSPSVNSAGTFDFAPRPSPGMRGQSPLRVAPGAPRTAVGEDDLRSWSDLLDEHQRLQQRQNELKDQKQLRRLRPSGAAQSAPVSAPRSPISGQHFTPQLSVHPEFRRPSLGPSLSTVQER